MVSSALTKPFQVWVPSTDCQVQKEPQVHEQASYWHQFQLNLLSPALSTTRWPVLELCDTVIAVLLIVLHLWNIYEYLNCSQYFEIEHNVFDRTLHNSCSYNWTQYFWDTYWGMTWISTFGGLVDITAYSIIIVLDQNVVSSQSFAAVQRVYS